MSVVEQYNYLVFVLRIVLFTFFLSFFDVNTVRIGASGVICHSKENKHQHTALRLCTHRERYRYGSAFSLSFFIFRFVYLFASLSCSCSDIDRLIQIFSRCPLLFRLLLLFFVSLFFCGNQFTILFIFIIFIFFLFRFVFLFYFCTFRRLQNN